MHKNIVKITIFDPFSFIYICLLNKFCLNINRFTVNIIKVKLK